MSTGTRTSGKHKRSPGTRGKRAMQQISMNSMVVCLLFIGLLLYLSAPVIRILSAPKTAVVLPYSEQPVYTLQGILIREELLIPSLGIGTVSVTESGQTVAAGALIAVKGSESLLAPVPGLYLRETDGLEHLTADMLSALTPRSLVQLRESQPTATANHGKLICGNEWLFAALTDAEYAERLQTNRSVSLTAQTQPPFSFTATVIQVSSAENGKCAVVLRCIDHLHHIAHLRQLTVTAAGTPVQGLRVPAEAVYADEHGSFVYRCSASEAEQCYVTIVSEETDWFLVSQDRSAYALHAGDTIILKAP